MGNACCANTEEQHDNFDIKGENTTTEQKKELKSDNIDYQNIDLTANHLPIALEATEANQMNPLPTQFAQQIELIEAWSLRDDSESDKLPTGGPYLYSEDSSTYKGQFLNGKKHGLGELINSNGDYFSGNFKNGFINGSGRLILASGDVYEGNFNPQIMLNGEGKQYHLTNSSKYSGEFKDGKYNGQGTLDFDENSHYLKYTGEFVDSLKHGNGVLEFRSGAKYEGAFSDDKFNGEGNFFNPKKGTYKGNFTDGQRNGDFLFTGLDGKESEVKYVEDVKQTQQY